MNVINFTKTEIKDKLKDSYFVTADFETTPIKTGLQDFILGGLFDGKNFFYFEDVEDFIEFCIQNISKVIYFHNLSYDFRFMMNYLFNIQLYDLRIIYNESKIIKVTVLSQQKYRGKQKTLVEFRDSYSIIPLSLKKCSETFNKKYFKTDYDFDPGKEVVINDELIEYLKQDCLSLYESLINFKDLLNQTFVNILDKLIDNLKLTIASNSLFLWKQLYNIHKIEQYWYNYDFFSKSLYGGRCEVFKEYGEKLYYYDFNSLYPAVMNDEKYPINRCKPMENEFEYNFYISYVKNINIPKMHIPPVPVKRDGLTIFPIGKVKDGVYNSVDLELFRKYGIDYDFVSGLGWSESENIFSKYISRLYDLKEESKDNNPGLYEISKLSMNSLFGKFGQSNNFSEFKKFVDMDEYIDGTDRKKHKNLKDVDVTEINNLYRLIYSSEKSITNHISSFILSYARRKLYEQIMDIIDLGGEIYYCDTDSIVTNLKIEHDKYKLGFLDLEYDNIKRGFFALPKMYYLDLGGKKDIVKSKGVEKKNFYAEEIIDYVLKKKNIVNSGVRVSKINKIVKNHLKPTECYDLTKNLFYESFRKRKRNGKNFNTSPIKLYEW